MLAADTGTPSHVLLVCLKENFLFNVTSDLETNVLLLGLIMTSSKASFISPSILIVTLLIERRTTFDFVDWT